MGIVKIIYMITGQELLVHKDVRITMIYINVLNACIEIMYPIYLVQTIWFVFLKGCYDE